MSLRFPCPQCAADIRVDSPPGTWAACATCFRRVVVPEDAVLIPADQATESGAPELPTPHHNAILTAFVYALTAFAVLMFHWKGGEDRKRGAVTDLEHPAEFAVVAFERTLEAESLADSMPGWLRFLEGQFDVGAGETEAEAESAWREILALPAAREDAAVGDALRARLCVLLAEGDRMSAASAELDSLSDREAAAAFRETFAFAYGLGDRAVAPRSAPALEVLTPPSDVGWRGTWTAARLGMRYESRAGNRTGANAWGARLSAEARALERRVVLVLLPVLGLTAAALVIAVVWIARRRRPSLRTAAAPIPPPWFTVDGFGGLIWATILSLPASIGPALAAERALPVWAGWAIFQLGIIPFLFVLRRQLTHPYGLRARDALGLSVARPALGRLVMVCILIGAADLVLQFTLWSWLESVDVTATWSEGAIEELAWGSPFDVAGAVAGIALGVPFLEEIAFRGVLYATLRRLLPVVPAAVVSALAFGLLHPYGLAGFAAVTLGGIWLALVYEATRSLWPTLFLHAFGNGLACAFMIATFR